MRNTVLMIIAAVAAVGLASCGKHTNDGPKQTPLKLEEHDANGGLRPSGRPEAPLIDPQKKSVVVLAAPSAPQLVARQEAKVAAEHEKVETQIHDLMGEYADNLRNKASREKYQREISQQLETYKRQSLELYLLRRQADSAPSADR